MWNWVGIFLTLPTCESFSLCFYSLDLTSTCLHSYRDGETEEWLGEWLQARGNRDQLVVATKYTNSYRAKFSNEVQANYGGNGSKSMKLSLENSLKRLDTTYIDLFYLHIWDYTTSIPELMHSLNDLIAAGKVLYLGTPTHPLGSSPKPTSTPVITVFDSSPSTKECGMPECETLSGRLSLWRWMKGWRSLLMVS
jgi:hypothetical protein